MKIYRYVLSSLLMGACCGLAFAGVAENKANSQLSIQKNQSLKEIQRQKVAGKLPAKIESSQEEPITSAPGEKTQYRADGKAWLNYMGLLTMQVNFTILTDIYFDGNDVYIQNPISQFPTNTYMKGTLDGDKVICSFPQLIYQELDSEGVLNDYFITRLNGEEVPNDWGTTSWVYSIPETDNEIVYTFVDGKLVMDESNYSVILGMVDEEDYWVGYGDCDVVYEEFNEVPVTAPEDLETEEWAFSSEGNARFVNVGFVDDEVYVQGLSIYIPEAWVKGVVDGDQIIFEGGQYMGYYSSPGGQYLAFLVGGEQFDDNGAENYYVLPELVFEYDAEAKSMSYDQTLFINSNTTYIRYLEMYHYPVIKFQPEDFNPTPSPVTLSVYQEYNGEYWAAQFIMPNTTPEGYILDPENLYWRLFLDDEVYEFDEEMYGEIPVNQTEVPYYHYCDSFEIYGQGALKTFFIYTEGFDTFSIQSIYKSETDGVETSYYSVAMTYNILNGDITYEDITTGVDKLTSAEKVNVEYYNLNGQKVNSPDKGIYIMRSIYSDGSITSNKVIRR